jgi:hypothetical protein
VRWLDLPGPARYIDTALDGLRDGHALVLATPRTGPPYLLAEIVDRLVRDHWHVRSVQDVGSSSPVHCLAEALDQTLETSIRPSINTLCQQPGEGRVLTLEVGQERWPSWRAAVTEFAEACRGLQSEDRLRIVIHVTGVPLNELPRPLPTLRCLPWLDVVGELDVLVHATHALRQHTDTPKPSDRLLARTVARLAGWDLDLADWLLDLPRDTLFSPVTALRAHATTLPSDDVDPSRPSQWHEGTQQIVDGQKIDHALWLAARGDPSGELAHRIWAAQAAELLPRLDLRRRALIKGLPVHLKPPLMVEGICFQDLFDLDYRPLCELVENDPRVPPTTKRHATRLRKARNRLAHLECLTAADALDETFWTV